MRKAIIILVLVIFLTACTGRTNQSDKTDKEVSHDMNINDSLENNCEENYIEVNGVNIYYEVTGAGKPVILVHGNGEDHRDFTEEIEQFSKAGYKVYAPDSRGHGKSTPVSEYHYIDMAEDIYSFITLLGIEKPALYGFSDGGIIGIYLEILHPGTLSILSVSGANINVNGLVDSLHQELIDNYKATGNPLTRLLIEEPDINPDDLSRITIPVLVMAGSNDLIKREHTELIASKISDCTMYILDGEDHGSYVIGSKIAGYLILEFFKKYNY